MIHSNTGKDLTAVRRFKKGLCENISEVLYSVNHGNHGKKMEIKCLISAKPVEQRQRGKFAPPPITQATILEALNKAIQDSGHDISFGPNISLEDTLKGTKCVDTLEELKDGYQFQQTTDAPNQARESNDDASPSRRP